MRCVLVTGMSGTGKSSSLAELRRRRFDVVDTDEPGWTEWRDDEGHVWREERIDELLTRDRSVPLFVSGTVSNQGRFYRRFDAVVLLSAPADVLLRRIESRTTNPYGKQPDELAMVLNHKQTVEPMLRRVASLEVDTTVSVDRVVETILGLVQS